MAKDRQSGGLYVIGNQEVSPLDGGKALGEQHKIDCRAGAAAQTHRRPATSARHQLHDVLEQRRLYLDLGDFCARGKKRLRLHNIKGDTLQFARIETVLYILQDLDLLLGTWIGDADFGQEAVQLSLRQRIGAFELDGVLRGKHGEKWGELVTGAANRDF